MVLADHFGYAGGARHGVTTYLLHVLPLLAAAGVELTVCFLRAPHAAAAELWARGIQQLHCASPRSPVATACVCCMLRA